MNSQTISVMSEYKKIGLDFEQLLRDKELLNSSLNDAEIDERDKQKELEATQFCYNLNPNSEYKKFLDEVSMQYLKARYKVKMLKMIQLLVQKYDSIDKCLEKREKLLDIIKFRKKVVQDLMGIRLLFDPFDRVKIDEQLKIISPFVDNSRTINRIRKEISDLTSRTEEMMKENNNYLITLSNTKELIESKIGFGDVDISPVIDDFEEQLITKRVEDNQVVGVRAISSKLNMAIVIQKANGVIERVNRMVNRSTFKGEPSLSSSLTPDLIIVPASSKSTEDELGVQISNENEFFADQFDGVSDVLDEVEYEQDVIDSLSFSEVSQSVPVEVDDDLFETISPFDEPIMFNDRREDLEPSGSTNVIRFPDLENDDSKVINFPLLENDMSEVSDENDEFWPSQSYSDEQISKILSLSNRKAA